MNDNKSKNVICMDGSWFLNEWQTFTHKSILANFILLKHAIQNKSKAFLLIILSIITLNRILKKNVKYTYTFAYTCV